MIRSQINIIGILLAAFVAVLPAAITTRGQEAPIRLVVKVRGSMAGDIEPALPLSNMTLAPGQSGNARVETFLNRHFARRIAPLYPDIVRLKKEQGLSDLEIAIRTRQRYARRANRLRTAFQPPEISRTYVLELDSTLRGRLTGILEDLKADPDVEFAEEDKVVTANSGPNDPYLSSSGSWGQSYGDLWGIQKIGAPAAWNSSSGAGVVVAVVDTGIDYNHPDIAGNVWTNTKEIAGNGIDDDHNGYVDDVRGWDFVGSSYLTPHQSNNPIDHYGHGTHVAGTIAAVGNNGIGVIGVAWGAQVMAVKALDDTGTGTDSTLSQGILYAANNGADVISASWGGQGSSQAIGDAVNYAYNLGAVFVAAAGNSSEDALNFYPANLWNVITVAASDPNDNLASFSNYGSKIDVAAPGVDILSLQASGTQLGPVVSPGYIRLSGTSMATPHVSGLAALILAANPEYSNEEVRQAVRSSATDVGPSGYDLSYGYGRENAAAAVGVAGALEAKISSPLNGTALQGPITVSGVARGTGFSHYTLEYGSGSLPTSWTTLQSGNAAVSGVLGTFDPTSLPDSTYDLRLTVYNTSGQTFIDRVQVVANPILISSPVAPSAPTSSTTFKNGAVISVTGNAVGANFQNFKVDWAPGLDASSGWQTTGITLVGGGTAAVVAGPLASWNTSAIATAGYYTIRLTVNAASVSRQVVTIVYLQPDLLSTNWPQLLAESTYSSAGVVPALNPDGTIRLVAENPDSGPTPARFWTFTPTGATQSAFLPGFGSFQQPAVANLDGNPGDEAVVADSNGIDVYRSDNSTYRLTTTSTLDYTRPQILIENLLGNSQWETLALGSNFQNQSAYISAWRADGSLLNNNFPIRVSDQNPVNSWYNRTRLLTGDIDGDGKKEIVVWEGLSSSTFTVRLFANDGSPRTWSVPVISGIPEAMAAADLDRNGKLETILAYYSGAQAILTVFQPDGTTRPGWPVILPNPNQNSQSFLAVADLNQDGYKEIVYSHETYLYVFSDNGAIFSSQWPLQTTGFGYASVVIGDVDGDGLPEIVTTINNTEASADPYFKNGSRYYDEKLLALRKDGSISKSWQLTGGYGFDLYAYPAPAIGDFNQDGTTDIAVAYSLSGSPTAVPGIIEVFSTGAKYNAALNDWPLIHQNARNTSVLPSTIVRAANSALFVGADSLTSGNWQTGYGADGYSLAGSAQKLPSYDPTFTVQGQGTWTWNASTNDPRAPRVPGSSTGIAATWYNASTFSFDVNMGTSPHQLALYALDWDRQGRSETIQIMDADNPGTSLDLNRTISGFNNGVYLVWNITGHVKIIVTSSSGPNAVINGVFFGGGSSFAPTPSLSIGKTHVGNFVQGQQNASYSITVSNAANAGATVGLVTVTENPPAGLTLVSMSGSGWNCGTNSCTRSDGLGGGLSYSPIAVTVNVAANASSPQVNQVGVSGGGSAPASASDSTVINAASGGGGPAAQFVGQDIKTQGSWQGVYGADAYSIAGDAQNISPNYAHFAIQNQSSWTWAPSTGDARALESASNSGRLAATWYNGSSFSFLLGFGDGGTHQVALYALDWDGQGRTETIQIVDPNTQAILDTRQISNFTNGTYMVWNITGYAQINVIANSGPNAAISGVFFGGAGSVTPSATAAWVSADNATQGAWIGKYGAGGFALANAGQNFVVPTAFSVQNSLTPWTWVSNPTPADPRDLETDATGDSIAAAWYSNTTFDFDLNLTDGQSHQVALYVLDWDGKGRQESVQMVDATSGATLDTRNVPDSSGDAESTGTTSSNVRNGTYLIWRVSGHVKINVTDVAGPNVVVSGIFVD